MRSILLVVLVAVTATVACGGGGGSSSNGGPTAPSNATTLTIRGQSGDQSFSPNPAAVSVGNMVAWRNADNTMHHIVSNDGSLDTGDIAPGTTSTALRLAVNGANYHCTIHPEMVGSINMATEPAPSPGDGY